MVDNVPYLPNPDRAPELADLAQLGYAAEVMHVENMPPEALHAVYADFDSIEEAFRDWGKPMDFNQFSKQELKDLARQGDLLEAMRASKYGGFSGVLEGRSDQNFLLRKRGGNWLLDARGSVPIGRVWPW